MIPPFPNPIPVEGAELNMQPVRFLAREVTGKDIQELIEALRPVREGLHRCRIKTI